MRELEGWQRIAVGAWLVCASLFQLYTAAFGFLEPRLQRSIHLTFILVTVFLLYPANKKSPKNKITLMDIIFSLVSLFPCLYIIVNCDRLNWRFEHVTKLLPIEVILGILAVIVLIEAVRRAVAPSMAYLTGIFIVYCFICPYLPGILYYKQLSFERIIENLYLLKDTGMFGSITGISATFIATFVIFGAFIQNTGIGEFFTKFACRIAGETRGGPAKVAVVSSGFFGSISGVAVANVYATGTFTIPLMKKLGYNSVFAGAVEAAASTGGMIMPPIMGAGAFVMAEITGTPYIKICSAAALGAILYYLAVGMEVHFEANKIGLRGMPKEQIVPWRVILKKFYLIIPLIGLIFLLIEGYSPHMAAFYSIVLAILVSFFSKNTMFSPVKFLETLALGAKNMVMVALACAGAGLIISIVSNSGLGLSISNSVVTLSGGNLFIALFLIMITSILLGTGLPCTPAYIIAISVGAPALLKMGVSLLSAHLFVFYFAILAAITPPVAMAAYAGASIAKSDPVKTGFTAFKLALTGFLVPYAFVYNPSLILQGQFSQIISSAIFSIFSVVLLAAAIIGWLNKLLSFWERIILVLLALVLIFPLLSLTILLWVRMSIIILVIGIFIKARQKKKAISDIS